MTAAALWAAIRDELLLARATHPADWLYTVRARNRAGALVLTTTYPYQIAHLKINDAALRRMARKYIGRPMEIVYESQPLPGAEHA